MKTVLIAAGALLVGLALGVLYCEATTRHLRKRLKEYRDENPPVSIFQSVTKFLFVTAQVFAILWVSLSYGIALYATVKLEQAFPVTELSQQAIITIIGAMALKVVENIFEHNEGVVFGRRPTNEEAPDEATEEEPEGRG